MNDSDPRLSRRDAERLLDAPAAHDSALGRALTRAGGPARAGELAREDATVAAFHQARLSPPPAVRKGFVSPRRLGSRAAVHAVVATAAVVALASGSFALAGSLDLPALPGQADDRATESTAGRTSTGAGGTVTDPSTGTSTSDGGDPSSTSGPGSTGPTRSGGTTSGHTSPSGTGTTPRPDLKGLCKAFQATERGDHGASLDSAAFAVLAEAAGSADVATFCVSLIGEPTVTPTRPTPTRPTPTKPTPTKPTPPKPTPTTTAAPTTATTTTGTSPGHGNASTEGTGNASTHGAHDSGGRP